MKIFFGIIFGLIVIVGGALVLQMTLSQQETRAVDQYLSTKGGTAVPTSWDGKVGRGI